MSTIDSGHHGDGMARRTKRLWTDEEKRSIGFQTATPVVSVAQVALHYAVNAKNLSTGGRQLYSTAEAGNKRTWIRLFEARPCIGQLREDPMKLHTTLMASCALAVIGTAAMADCAADLAQLNSDVAGEGQGGGISKDGSLAPLESPDGAAGSDRAASPVTEDTAVTGEITSAGDAVANDMTGAYTAASDETSGNGEAGAEGIAKDGSLAPLEGTDAEAKSPIAMSGQDAQAQQAGEPAAAEMADDGVASADTAEATMTDNAGAAAETIDSTASAAAGASDRSALLAEAQTAIDAGDEEACLAAIGKIEAL